MVLAQALAACLVLVPQLEGPVGRGRHKVRWAEGGPGDLVNQPYMAGIAANVLILVVAAALHPAVGIQGVTAVAC